MDILRDIATFWPVFTGIVMTFLYLGALHQMVKANNKALTELSDRYNILHDFTIKQESTNGNTNKDFSSMMTELKNHVMDSTSRYTALGARIDDLFKLLGKRKDD